MLSVKIQVKYENDWTAALRQYDVQGQFLASTFRGRRYLGIISLDVGSDEQEDVLETIRSDNTTESVEVLESRPIGYHDRTAVTILLRSSYLEYTPLQILLYEGYLPFGAFGELENGQMTFDLLVEDRDSISEAVSLLREFGSVQVERITQDFHSHVVPSVTEWQTLLESFPTRQREILTTAVESGYYELPRETTLDKLASEIGVAKTTVSQHLRKAERRIIEFVVEYVNLAHSQ